MSLGDSFTIVVGFSLPIFLGLLTYAYQERQRRRAALFERRRAHYETLIRSLVELLGARTADDRSRLMTEIETGWLFASDEVLDASYDYLAEYDKVCRSAMEDGGLNSQTVLAKVRSDPVVRQELRERLADVFAQMRRDIGRKTIVTDDWARKHFDIYCWGILSTGELSPSAGDWGEPPRDRPAPGSGD